jgi:hypothetical protein
LSSCSAATIHGDRAPWLQLLPSRPLEQRLPPEFVIQIPVDRFGAVFLEIAPQLSQFVADSIQAQPKIGILLEEEGVHVRRAGGPELIALRSQSIAIGGRDIRTR